MSEITRTNRLFEQLLFSGVPESPKGIYEADSHAHALTRARGEPAGGTAAYGSVGDPVEPIVAWVWFDSESREMILESADEHGVEPAPTRGVGAAHEIEA
jgi:hypothetical protein